MDITEYWIKKAKSEKDVAYKFIMLWIAFNSLYAGRYNENECDCIKNYCDRHETDLKELNLFDETSVEIFKEDSITDMRLESPNSFKEKRFKNLKANDVQALIMSIYQVRCNLFHGSKTLMGGTDSRDYKLIEASANIMEIILNKLCPTKELNNVKIN